MRSAVSFPLVLLVFACANEPCPPAVAPVAAPEPAVTEVPTSSTPSLPALATFEPDDSTLPEVREQFGRLVGEWSCQGERRQPDGTFVAGPGRARWTFFYTLGAQAIGDVFEPAATSGAVGINLRVYDPDRQVWTLAWTTPQLRRYDQFEARAEGETIVMRGEIAAKGPFPDHAARITFSEMGPERFEWVYEAASPGTDGPWQVQSRLHCDSAG
jgi:hypothetical protein